jgi:uncharacterized membrane protein
MKLSQIVLALMILLSFVTGILLYPAMPPLMASHWGIRGEVNGYMPKFWGLFLMPIISVGLILLFTLIPKLDPLARNIEEFRNYYDNFVVLIISFLFYIHIITLLWNLGTRLDMNRMMAPALAILFIYCGILIRHAKRNWSIGIRTAWTLSSDSVWDKTHRLGGTLFTISGAICLLGVIFPAYAFLFILVPVLSAALISVLYSYIVYAQEKKLKQSGRPRPSPKRKRS